MSKLLKESLALIQSFTLGDADDVARFEFLAKAQDHEKVWAGVPLALKFAYTTPAGNTLYTPVAKAHMHHHYGVRLTRKGGNFIYTKWDAVNRDTKMQMTLRAKR